MAAATLSALSRFFTRSCEHARLRHTPTAPEFSDSAASSGVSRAAASAFLPIATASTTCRSGLLQYSLPLPLWYGKCRGHGAVIMFSGYDFESCFNAKLCCFLLDLQMQSLTELPV